MKKMICIILLIVLVSSACAESIDLSSLSFEELRTLQSRISKELTTRPEWKSVPVPPGFYQIGVDIPAGEWCITCGEAEFSYISVHYGAEANDSKTKIESPWEFGKLIYKKGKSEGKDIEKLVAILSEGYYLTIEYGQAVFSTPEKTDLGF